MSVRTKSRDHLPDISGDLTNTHNVTDLFRGPTGAAFQQDQTFTDGNNSQIVNDDAHAPGSGQGETTLFQYLEVAFADNLSMITRV